MLKGVNRLLLITVSNWMSSKINSLRTVNINIYILHKLNQKYICTEKIIKFVKNS